MKMFDAGKTRMIGLPYGEKNNTLSRFHTIVFIQYQNVTNGFAISISCVSMLTRNKNCMPAKAAFHTCNIPFNA